MTKHRLNKYRTELQTYEALWGSVLDDDPNSVGPLLDTVTVYKEFEPRSTGSHPITVYPWMLLCPIDPLVCGDLKSSILDDEAEEAEDNEDLEAEGAAQQDELPSSNPE